jgi:hypothetical protein
METKRVTAQDLADMKLAEHHLKIATRHRQLASDAIARVRKRQNPHLDMNEFDPFDLGEK